MDTLPTFLLRGTNHKTIVDSYNNGDFATKTISYDRGKFSPPKFDLIPSKAKPITNTGVSHDNAIFIRQNTKHVFEVYTTNQKEYITVVSPINDSNKSNTVYTGAISCMWCRRSLNNNNVIPVSIPIKLVVKNDKYYFHNTGKMYCSTNCADSHLNELLCNRNNLSLYADSKHLLRQLHYMLTGDTELIPAPDWTLLISNGGTMTPDIYYNAKRVYTFNPNLIFVPVKLQYETVKSNK